MIEDDAGPLDEDAIREIVVRLSRPHRSGGKVIERAAILASGHDSTAVLEWITSHGGEPEALAATNAGGGLHGARQDRSVTDTRAPLRYVLPPDALA